MLIVLLELINKYFEPNQQLERGTLQWSDYRAL